jgi:hypothetical protein
LENERFIHLISFETFCTGRIVKSLKIVFWMLEEVWLEIKASLLIILSTDNRQQNHTNIFFSYKQLEVEVCQLYMCMRKWQKVGIVEDIPDSRTPPLSEMKIYELMSHGTRSALIKKRLKKSGTRGRIICSKPPSRNMFISTFILSYIMVQTTPVKRC